MYLKIKNSNFKEKLTTEYYNEIMESDFFTYI